MKVTVVRKAHFNAAHRLFRPDWDFEKNDRVFGLCNNPNFHGHNYELEVFVKGDVNPETGFVIDLKILKQVIEDKVCSYLDHKNLNLDIDEFKKLNPTAENIVQVIWNLLRPELDQNFELAVKLYETPRNFVFYSNK